MKIKMIGYREDAMDDDEKSREEGVSKERVSAVRSLL